MKPIIKTLIFCYILLLAIFFWQFLGVREAKAVPESEPIEVITPESTPTDGGGGAGAGNYGLGSITGLPTGEVSDVIIRIIRYVLSLVGVVLFAMLIYGGFMYMTSAGNEDQIKKAKNVLTYAIIGIVIIAMAFLIAEFVIGALWGGV